MANTIRAMIKYHREWFEKHGTRFLGSDSEELQQEIDEGTPDAFRQIPGSLDGLATCYGIRGTISLIDGQESGWKDISTAIDFRAWSLKVRAESFFRWPGRTANLTNYVGQAASLVCVSQKWGRMAESLLRRIDSDPDSVDQAYWKSRRFEPFVMECCLIRDGKEPVADNLESPYLEVLRNWHDDDALVSALEQVCDYHCANMDDVGGDWDPEFDHPPFDLIPCEVMFVRQLRKALGLSVPEVPHELVSLLSPPDAIESVGEEHALLGDLSKAFEQCFR